MKTGLDFEYERDGVKCYVAGWGLYPEPVQKEMLRLLEELEEGCYVMLAFDLQGSLKKIYSAREGEFVSLECPLPLGVQMARLGDAFIMKVHEKRIIGEDPVELMKKVFITKIPCEEY